MVRFIVRNYGPSRQFTYKGQPICLCHDQAIESNDEDMVKALEAEGQIHVTDRGAGVVLSAPLDDSVDEETTSGIDDSESLYKENHSDDSDSDSQQDDDEADSLDLAGEKELTYESMTVDELKTLAKARNIPHSGLRKGALIQALVAYDDEEDSSSKNLEDLEEN